MRAKSKKAMFDIMREVRLTWDINPRTRVQDDERKDKKKRRQAGKKDISEKIAQDD